MRDTTRTISAGEHSADGSAHEDETSEYDVIATAMRWLDAGHRVELVTVARTWGSSPRPPGSLAAVRDDGQLVGSVSGGCIEKQLVARATTHAPASVQSMHVADEDARRVGLTCGGRLELVFERLDSSALLAPIIAALDERRRIMRRVHVDSGAVSLMPVSDVAAPAADRAADSAADSTLDSTADSTASFSNDLEWDGQTLSRIFGPAWRVLLVGAGELSRFTARFARAVDFEVIVCDPRESFRDAFALRGVRLIDALPDEAVALHAHDTRSAVLALSHDPTLDDLALEEAIGGDCFHIAALGSRRSHASRSSRLRFLGIEASGIARISAPAGIDIGSRTAAEIAISIVAELIRARDEIRRRGAAVNESARPKPVSRLPPGPGGNRSGNRRP